MNTRTWMRAIRRSDLPRTIMKTFGYRRKRNRPMTFSLMGIIGSAAAAYVFRNRMNGAGRIFRKAGMNGKWRSAINRPMAEGLTEFAKEFTSGINEKWNGSASKQKDWKQPAGQPSHTSPESDELISQIGNSARTPGNDEQLEDLTNRLIKTNVRNQ